MKCLSILSCSNIKKFLNNNVACQKNHIKNKTDKIRDTPLIKIAMQINKKNAVILFAQI